MKCMCACAGKWADTALRIGLGWYLAYLGIWALTSAWTYSWSGTFRCAHWLGGDLFRMLAASNAMPVVDGVLAWGLLFAGLLLMIGRWVRPAVAVGFAYSILIYLVNPPHFGHTGVSHFLYIDRNIIAACLFLYTGLNYTASAQEERT